MIFDQNRPGVKPVGINLDTIKKGKSYSEEDVLHTFRQITPDLDQKLERYDRGEISDPYKYAVAAVKNHIEIETEKMGCPVIAKVVMVDFVSSRTMKLLTISTVKPTLAYANTGRRPVSCSLMYPRRI